MSRTFELVLARLKNSKNCAKTVRRMKFRNSSTIWSVVFVVFVLILATTGRKRSLFCDKTISNNCLCYRNAVMHQKIASGANGGLWLLLEYIVLVFFLAMAYSLWSQIFGIFSVRFM